MTVIRCGNKLRLIKKEEVDLRDRAKSLGNHYIHVRDLTSYEEAVRAATDPETLALIDSIFAEILSRPTLLNKLDGLSRPEE
jgi:hypothetical protein